MVPEIHCKVSYSTAATWFPCVSGPLTLLVLLYAGDDTLIVIIVLVAFSGVFPGLQRISRTKGRPRVGNTSEDAVNPSLPAYPSRSRGETEPSPGGRLFPPPIRKSLFGRAFGGVTQGWCMGRPRRGRSGAGGPMAHGRAGVRRGIRNRHSREESFRRYHHHHH